MDVSIHRDASMGCPRRIRSRLTISPAQMPRRFIFSSESVGEGHPDKVCDTISDAVLDACLAQDKNSRVGCQTDAESKIVIVGGEITATAKLDYVQIVRDAVREIGYVNDDDVFHA